MEFTFSEKQIIKELVKKELCKRNSIYNRETLDEIRKKVKEC